MNTILTQLATWPPKASTVVGLGVLVGAIDYAIFGNVLWALGVAGLFKVVCPEDATADDQVTQILNQLPALAAAKKG